MKEKFFSLPIAFVIALQCWICLQIVDLKTDIAALKVAVADQQNQNYEKTSK